MIKNLKMAGERIMEEFAGKRSSLSKNLSLLD